MSERWSYWNGPDEIDRREKYVKAFKPEYQQNGENTQQRFRAAIDYAKGQYGLELPAAEWASGWRPPSINETTSNAAKGSTHLTAEAGDRRDSIDGSLAWAFFRDPHPLQVHGIWMEHPVATVIRSWETAYQKWKKKDFEGDCPEPQPWCHGQTRPPASGNRIYWPDSKAAGEWDAFLKMGGHAGMTFADWLKIRRDADEA